MGDTHSDDLRNVVEGDSVTLETTEGDRFAEVVCDMRQIQNADPRSGEVRETTIWAFTVGDKDLTVSIVEGLKSSPDDPDFPIHREASLGVIGERDGWEKKGHIESVEIHGPQLEA